MSIENNVSEFVDYLEENYGDSEKIVEIGIGKFRDVFLKIKEELDIEVFSIDIIESREDFVDDITDPRMGIYEDSDLIYSIRPPLELQKSMARVCEEVESDLIIIPFDSEILELDEFFDEFYLENLGDLTMYRGIN
ncbi:hypothetical protein C9439_01535 [archaeon SCG-AAA382B04]|nr:hypothetical protein C9439_01535 [archaeon SCG-AAA382B04]